MTYFKGSADAAATGGVVLAFFELIPWAEIAAIASAVYFCVSIYYTIRNNRAKK